MATLLQSTTFLSRKADGTPNALGKLYTYAAGTLTPVASYTTAALNVEHTNPVTLDAAGTAEVWLDGSLSYRLIEKTAELATIRDTDNVYSDPADSSVVNVGQYGAVSGADATTAIQEALDACPVGGTVLFEPNAEYTISAALSSKYAGLIDFRGATLTATADVDTYMLFCGEQLAMYSSFTPFTATANTNKFTVPSGVTLAAGNVIQLRSDTERLTDYNHGMWATVVSVDAGVATLNTVFYDTFTVNDIKVMRGHTGLQVRNGNFDFSAAPNVQQDVRCLQIEGGNVTVDSCNFVGSQYAGAAVSVRGDTATINNCKAYGFRNTQGLSDGGRVGYGFSFEGNNGLIENCLTYACKHGLTAGSRTGVSYNVAYKTCQVFEDASATSTDYSGSIDIHANVIGTAEVIGCTVVGQARLLAIRSPARVIGGSYTQTGNGQILEGFDGPYDGLIFEGLEYSLGHADSTFLTIGSSSAAAVTAITNCQFRNCRATSSIGRFMNLTRATDVTGLRLEGNIHAGASFFRMSGGNVSGLTIVENALTLTEWAAKIICAGATYAHANIDISRNRIYKTSTASAEGAIQIGTNDSSKVVATGLTIRDNNMAHTTDTGTGYAISLDRLDITGFRLSDNSISRGTFRCVAVGGCEILNGVVSGNVIDGDFYVTNTAAATVLENYSVIGNVGATYTVSVADFGVTKTRAVDSGNNFGTYAP